MLLNHYCNLGRFRDPRKESRSSSTFLTRFSPESTLRSCTTSAFLLATLRPALTLCSIVRVLWSTRVLYLSSSLKLLEAIADLSWALFLWYSFNSSATFFSSSSYLSWNACSRCSFYTVLSRRPERSLHASKLSSPLVLGFIDLSRDPKPPLPPSKECLNSILIIE